MESPRAYCELLRLDDVVRLYGLKHSLEARGVAAEVWRTEWCGWRSARGGALRLMVPRDDVVYARWAAAASGLDGLRGDEGAGDEASAGASSGSSRLQDQAALVAVQACGGHGSKPRIAVRTRYTIMWQTLELHAFWA
jgi:hypothetical protein